MVGKDSYGVMKMLFTSIVKTENLPDHHILVEGTMQDAFAKCPCGFSATGHKHDVNSRAFEHLRKLAQVAIGDTNNWIGYGISKV